MAESKTSRDSYPAHSQRSVAPPAIPLANPSNIAYAAAGDTPTNIQSVDFECWPQKCMLCHYSWMFVEIDVLKHFRFQNLPWSNKQCRRILLRFPGNSQLLRVDYCLYCIHSTIAFSCWSRKYSRGYTIRTVWVYHSHLNAMRSLVQRKSKNVL